MAVTPASLFSQFNATIKTVNLLIQILEVKITRTSVRKKLTSFPNYPNLTLHDVVEAFEGWNVSTFAFSASEKTLNEVPMPSIAYLEDKDPEHGTTSSGTFVVLDNVEKDQVCYIHPIFGVVTETVSQFAKKWKGVILSVDPDQNSGEKQYVARLAEQQKKDDEFKKSIKVFPQFMTGEECKALIAYCNTRSLFSQSKVGLGKGDISPTRTSYSAVINDRSDPIINSVINKASQALNLEMLNVKSLQCVRYSVGQQFRAHYDSDHADDPTHTILVYLNEDFEGGETFFPEIDFTVTPRTGSCIIFRNIDNKGQVIERSAHSGLPLKAGTKYACNIWIHNSLAMDR